MQGGVSAGFAILFIVLSPISAQPVAPVVHFEVASIRTTSFADARQQDLIHPLTISGRRIDFGAPTLNNLISTAFAVRPQQLIGAPSIRADEHYVIEAVMPEGAAGGQMPEMLRGLLEERFHLAVHRETREVKGYALVRSKNPLRLEPPRELDRSICAPWIDDPSSSGNQTCLHRSPGGVVSASTDSPWGPVQVTGLGYDAKEEYPRVTMVQLANRLTIHFANLSCDPGNPVWTPVEDRTGISGEHYVAMQVNSEDFCALPESYSSALEKYGLKLEKAMVRAEFVVVDRVDAHPTEN